MASQVQVVKRHYVYISPAQRVFRTCSIRQYMHWAYTFSQNKTTFTTSWFQYVSIYLGVWSVTAR